MLWRDALHFLGVFKLEILPVWLRSHPLMIFIKPKLSNTSLVVLLTTASIILILGIIFHILNQRNNKNSQTKKIINLNNKESDSVMVTVDRNDRLKNGGTVSLGSFPAIWETSTKSFFLYKSNSNAFDNTNSPTSLYSDISVQGDSFAVRCQHAASNTIHFTFNKVGRVSNSVELSPFASKISDNPIDEFELILKDPSSNKGENPPLVMKANNETLVSGDVVTISRNDSSNKRHYLTIKEEWWLGYSESVSDSRTCFIITIVDERGDAQFGVPIIHGLPFRLRSARYPRYEVGYQLTNSSTKSQFEPLLLYEWTNYGNQLTKPIKWKFGGTLSPLIISSIPIDLPSITNVNTFTYSIKQVITRKSASNNKAHAQIVGHTSFYHKTLNETQSALLVHCTTLNSNGSKNHFLTIKQNLELLLKDFDSGSISSYVGRKHDSATNGYINMMNSRLGSIFDSSAGPNLIVTLIKPTLLDSMFIAGIASDYNVNLSKLYPHHVYYTICCRCVHEGKYCEEVVVITNTALVFHSSSLAIELSEVLNVYKMPLIDSPVPGLHVASIETIDRTHYLLFKRVEKMEEFTETIISALNKLHQVTETSGDRADKTRSNSVFQWFSFKKHTGLSSYFVLTSDKWLPVNRKILNSRKMVFDSIFADRNNYKIDNYCKFSEILLKEAFALDSESDGSKELDVEKICKFLNKVTLLKSINLQEINLQSIEGVCFFANIFHTLLLHARLVHTPPDKGLWNDFFHLNSYEIGNDVFSLAELEQCVLRGALSTCKTCPTGNNLATNDDHYKYALGSVDPRINFLINTGSICNPRSIYVLTTAKYNSVLDAAVREYLTCVRIDKKMAIFPHIMKLYADDFGEIKYFVGKFIPDIETIEINSLMYQTYAYESHSNLLLIQ